MTRAIFSLRAWLLPAAVLLVLAGMLKPPGYPLPPSRTYVKVAARGKVALLGLLLLLLAAVLTTPAQAQYTPNISVQILVDELDNPWDLTFAPDRTMLFTERDGRIKARLTNGDVVRVTADMSDIDTGQEAGLMAILVDRGFSSNRRFYTCQVHDAPHEVQVIAWTINDDYTQATRVADPLVGGIPAGEGGRHNGCRLRFGRGANELYISTGDAEIGSTPQDLMSLGGKVLRVRSTDGTGYPGNPFSATSSPPGSPLVYTYGHRNVQGLALRNNGQMWAVEHGPTGWDEINLLTPGGNYGWDPRPSDPNEEYDQDVPMTDTTKFPNAIRPKWTNGDDVPPHLAPSGGIFLTGSQWGSWQGRLAVATLAGQRLLLFDFTSSGTRRSGPLRVRQLDRILDTDNMRREFRLRTPMMGPDGALYITTSSGGYNDKILRVTASRPAPPQPPGGGGGGGGGPPAPPPAKIFSIPWATVAEGETARLAVTLSTLAPQPSGLTFDVSYDYSGSASADDTGATPATLHVPADQTAATLSVPIATDRLVEGEESFTVTISPRTGDWKPRWTGAETARVTITDVDVGNQPNRPPVFANGASVMRSIAENTAADTPIGAPVQAGDPDSDTLTYSLGGTDAASFDINTANGQLLTDAALDRETKGSYAVTVTAEDPDGLTASIDVTITVTDVDEAPELSGSAAVSYAESRTDPVATYTAMDPESQAITWSLSGDDEGDFTIAGGVLTFAAIPDYEAPADADADNVYEVTVTASDPSGLSDSIDVTVTVLNEDENLTLSSALPGVGIELTAILTDPNGPVSGVTWRWKRSSDDGTYADIAGATSASYTPVAEDVGYHLRVTVTYTDRLGVVKSATATTPNAVAADDPLVARYDANTNGEIEKREVIAAINDYLFGDPATITKADVIRLINLYLFPDE